MHYLIAGLGNIGDEYEHTRHNIGFKVADALAEKYDACYSLERLAYIAHYKDDGKIVHLIKPTTYMNLSGNAIAYWLQYYKIPLENLLVIVDDKDLPFGRLRLRGQGSAGGHNGLRSIEGVLKTNAYARLRFGIGDNFADGRQVQYVLGKWTATERDGLIEHIPRAVEGARQFILQGLATAMNVVNK